MIRATIRRSGAIFVSAVLLASLAVATVSAPTSAEPTCNYRPASIVGTAKGEVIRGTPGRDVIAAGGGRDIVYGLGGDDIICGGRGRDRLYGGPGNDRLLGGKGGDLLYGGAGRDHLLGGPDSDRLFGSDGNDRLLGGAYPDRVFGGPGRDQLFGGPDSDQLFGGADNDLLAGDGGHDRCRQGPGAGPVFCESIARVEPRNLAIAFSDLDGDDRYGPGDVLISRFFDTNGDGTPSVGDTIYMGRYPIDFEMTAFADWGVESYQLRKGDMSTRYSQITGGFHFVGANIRISRGVYQDFSWNDRQEESYREYGPPGGLSTSFIDIVVPDWDEYQERIFVDPDNPSQAETKVSLWRDPTGIDDGFIDVVVYP